MFDTSIKRPRVLQVVFQPVLIMLLGLGIFILLPTFVLPRIGFDADIRGRTVIALVGTFVAEGIMFVVLLGWLKSQGKTLRDIGLQRPTSVIAIIVGVMVALIYAVSTLSNPLVGTHVTEISLFKMLGIGVGVFGAFVEECVFRGYVISQLELINRPVIVQILLSGISFGIIHVGFDLVGIVLTFSLGIVLATIYVIGKRSLTPSLISHIIINVLVEPWLLLFIVTAYSKLAHVATK